MFVKICGITNEEDALLAVAMGADAVGFIFAPSVRQILPERARDIVRRLPHGVTTVGVFRDEAPQRVVEVVNALGLTGAQLHGHESPAETAWVGSRVKYVVKVFSAGDHLLERVDDYDVEHIMIDSAGGGSGQIFDWSIAENLPLHRKIILAGGLNPENVAMAIERVHPWGVDVATGVESSPGKKDALKVMRFINEAKAGELDEESDDASLIVEIDDDGRPVVEPYDYDWEDEPPSAEAG